VVRRVIPEAKPRNPKLADVLRVYRKWEGRGIGMATLVDISLRNEIDLPFYRLRSDEVTLHLRAGKLLDDGVEQIFDAYGRYIEERMGTSLSEPQRLVLAYLIKSELMNRLHHFSILLTPDNNHFAELRSLERGGLIHRHPSGTDAYPVYVADRVLMNEDWHLPELRTIFGAALDGISLMAKQVLGVIYRFDNYAKEPGSTAKQAAFSLWPMQPDNEDAIRAFDTFYRRVRRTFNQLHSGEFIQPASIRYRYSINRDFRKSRLL
jgi:ATP-dependent DNA helicase RecG